MITNETVNIKVEYPCDKCCDCKNCTKKKDFTCSRLGKYYYYRYKHMNSLYFELLKGCKGVSYE